MMNKKTLVTVSAVIYAISGCGGETEADMQSGVSSTPPDTVDSATDEAALATSLPPQVSTSVLTASTAKQLQDAIVGAVNGTEILLQNGVYAGPFIVSDKHGKAGNGLIIKAVHQGKVVISGQGGFSIENSSYVTISGLKFVNAATAVSVYASNNIQITRNLLALAANTSATKWIVINGAGSSDNFIDHNEFGPRQDLGQMISIDGENGQVAQRTMIQYNYFHDATPQPANGGETIRVGLSGLSMSDGLGTIQYNLFMNCDSDSEVVSVKSGHNTVRYNTFINNRAQVTSRHGHGNSFYGNFFFGDAIKPRVGGFRIYGNDHKIYNNYMQALTEDAIQLDSGDYDGGSDGYGSAPSKDQLALHWRIYRAQIVNNTIVDSNTGIVIGGGHTLPPLDMKIANNLVRNATGILFQEKAATNTLFESNIGFGSTLDNVPRLPREIDNVDPLLMMFAGMWKLSPRSPAIGAGTGAYTFVTKDMDGQTRLLNDIGADSYSTTAIISKPLTPADVGPDAN